MLSSVVGLGAAVYPSPRPSCVCSCSCTDRRLAIVCVYWVGVLGVLAGRAYTPTREAHGGWGIAASICCQRAWRDCTAAVTSRVSVLSLPLT